MQEKTPYYYYQLQFGHNKALSKEYRLSDIHIDILHIESKGDQTFIMWRQGFTVLLEKKFEARKVDKMREILLIEDNLNFIKNY